MTDDDSNDVVMIVDGDEPTAAEAEGNDRPIMQLFERLISNDNKQNTVLTNVQIISILNKEFDIDITVLHDLEVDIYLNIVKRFLKDWPQWDEFDRGISLLRRQNATATIKKTLENNYKSLKDFLKVQLDSAKPLAQEAVIKMLEEHSKKMESVDTSDVALEILCSRKQLNELICNHPNADSDIFNLPEAIPSTIKYVFIPFNTMINWWGIQIKIESKYLTLTRNNMHQLKHTLVNRYNGARDLRQDLNTNVQIKDQKRPSREMDKNDIYKVLESIITKQCADKLGTYDFLVALIRVLKSDLDAITGKVKVPAAYRQHSNKYPYYRKLCKELPTPQTGGRLYDLYIEEVFIPMHVLDLIKVELSETNLSLHHSHQVSLVIECVECNVKFSGGNFHLTIAEHFNVHHCNEPDWTCTNCALTFKVIELADKKWYHECKKSPKE